MKGILGRKVGMTQIFDDNGNVIPVTVIQAGPCYITQIKTIATDGYNAVQMGFEEVKPKRLKRPQAGHLGQLKVDRKHPKRRQFPQAVPPVRQLREFRTSESADYELGAEVRVDLFTIGDRVDIVANCKGRGFAGVIKRHGFGGGPITHGQSDRQRSPGSIGSTSTPGRVYKGMRMAGRMGNQQVTSQNVQIVRVDLENNLLAVKGSVPGPKGGFVVIKEARKQ